MAHSTYTKELAEEICLLVSNGSNIDLIGQMDKFPTKQTIYNWFNAHADFFDDYTRAREARADWRTNRMETICNELREGIIDHQTARILIDNDKWQAGKENPKRYGDKNIHTGPDGDGPVETAMIITFVDASKNDD